MKLLNVGLCGLLLVAGCGGASDDGGRTDESVNSDDDGADDDNSGTGDDDADDDSDDDTDEDDDASDDDVADDDTADDDTSAPIGVDDDVESDDDVQGDDDLVPADDDVVPGDDDMVVPADDDVVPGDDDVVSPEPSMQPQPEPVTPSEECSVVGQSISDTYCDLREQCGNVYKYSSCSQLASGVWSCTCSDGGVYKEVEVTNPEAPCSLVQDACSDIGNPEFTGEETCALEFQAAQPTYCETRTRCTQAAPYNDQISVVQSRYEYTSCYDNGLDGLSCNCNGTAGSFNFTLNDVATSDACNIGSEVCAEGGTAEPTTERVCEPSYSYNGTNYCQEQMLCTQTVEVNGSPVELSETESANCSTTSGVTTCSCYNSSRSYSFETDVTSTDGAACDTGLAVCSATEEPVTDGPVECAVSSQSASATYCSANIQCTQDATIGGNTVGLFGSLYAYCQPDADGAWACQCQSNTATVDAPVSATDGWGACEEAAAQCPDLVEVEIGSGGGIRPPCGYYLDSAGSSSGAAAPDGAAVGVPVPGPGIPCPL